MTYGKRLNEALKAADKTRKHLADELGVTPQAVGMVITGGGLAERKLSFENNQKAAKFLRVDETWLFTGEGDMQPTAKVQEPSGYSAEALALGWLLDQIPNRLDKTIANNLATAALLEVLQRSGASPTDRPGARVPPTKQSA